MHNEDGFAAEDHRPAGGNIVRTLCRPRLRMHNESVLKSTVIRMFKQLTVDLFFIRIICYRQ